MSKLASRLVMLRRIFDKFGIPIFTKPKPVVAVLRFSGVIGQVGNPIRQGIYADGFIKPIEQAFNLKNLVCVAVQINSPGGSPVQSSLIFKRIRSLAEEKDVPVIAFAEDAAASGGYLLACAADEIFADESSIIGSIGVVSSGFGFVELLEKLGIERRVYTAGKSKAMLDPFKEEKVEDVARLKELQEDVHDTFRSIVKSRRGDRIVVSDEEVYTGAFWTGRRANEMGLIDGIGELTKTMQEKYGEQVVFKPVGEKKSWLKQRLSASRLMGFGQKHWFFLIKIGFSAAGALKNFAFY